MKWCSYQNSIIKTALMQVCLVLKNIYIYIFSSSFLLFLSLFFFLFIIWIFINFPFLCYFVYFIILLYSICPLFSLSLSVLHLLLLISILTFTGCKNHLLSERLVSIKSSCFWLQASNNYSAGKQKCNGYAS